MTSHRRSFLPSAAGVLLLAVLASSLTGIVRAQGLGTIVGTITDPSGALVPGATVRVTDEGTSQGRDQCARLLRVPVAAPLELLGYRGGLGVCSVHA